MVITMERQAISEFCMVAMIVDKTAPRRHAQSSYIATTNFIQHALPVLFYFLKGGEIPLVLIPLRFNLLLILMDLILVVLSYLIRGHP